MQARRVDSRSSLGSWSTWCSTRSRILATAAAGLVFATVFVGSACASRGEHRSGRPTRVAMEVEASRRGTQEIEVAVRLLDGTGDVIATPRVLSRIGESARVVIGARTAAAEATELDAEADRESERQSHPRIEIEVESWPTAAGGRGLVEVSVAATIVLEGGRVERPVARLTVGPGPPARVTVG